MSANHINRVVLTGNLTHEPELRAVPSGGSVCQLRIACNTRRKSSSSGEWEDKPNFFDVAVWGTQGENCARFLAKGRPVAIDGRLEWREWQTKDGAKRQAVHVIAETVQFLANRTTPKGHDVAEPQPDPPTDHTTEQDTPFGTSHLRQRTSRTARVSQH